MSKVKTSARKQDRVYESLREGILEGRFPPGARLLIDDIAHELDVSHIPVREAMQQLQAQGYVTIEPYVGTTVSELEPDWIHEVFELMATLEEISGRAACTRMTDSQLDELEEIIRGMDGLVSDPNAWSEANVVLHRFVCESSGNHLTGRLLDTVLDQWDRLRRFYLREVSGQRLKDAQREHWDILQALRSRDAERLAHVIREHNRKAFRAYARHLDMDAEL